MRRQSLAILVRYFCLNVVRFCYLWGHVKQISTMVVTFKPVIIQGNRRKDGTWTVYIRVTFKGV